MPSEESSDSGVPAAQGATMRPRVKTHPYNQLEEKQSFVQMMEGGRVLCLPGSTVTLGA